MSHDSSSSRGDAQATPTGSRGFTPSISPAAKARSGSAANSLFNTRAASPALSGRADRLPLLPGQAGVGDEAWARTPPCRGPRPAGPGRRPPSGAGRPAPAPASASGQNSGTAQAFLGLVVADELDPAARGRRLIIRSTSATTPGLSGPLWTRSPTWTTTRSSGRVPLACRPRAPGGTDGASTHGPPTSPSTAIRCGGRQRRHPRSVRPPPIGGSGPVPGGCLHRARRGAGSRAAAAWPAAGPSHRARRHP